VVVRIESVGIEFLLYYETIKSGSCLSLIDEVRRSRGRRAQRTMRDKGTGTFCLFIINRCDGSELEHLKIETRLINEMFAGVMGE
jgi:hypothetical protein